MARVPLSKPTGQVGTENDAVIYALGCIDGFFVMPAPTTWPDAGKRPLDFFRVSRNTDVVVASDEQADLSARTKMRLSAWLKRAYPARFRLQRKVPGLEYSWRELLDLPLPRMKLQRELYAQREAELLGVPISDRRMAFNETLKTIKKRQRKTQAEALHGGVQFSSLRRGPGRRVYMKGDRISTFFHFLVQARDRTVVYDAEIDWTGVDLEALTQTVMRKYGIL